MVVVSGTWVKNVVSFPINGELITTVKMAAKAVLICRPNSHPFQERTLSLEQPVKIGRSVARARAVPNNAIFDCKVLSRNHALLWYENGKFYLQDTKSSNGTFVNNQRLSKGAEESPPREVCSGDIVQFGVDVMENARKVTHGCIVATVKLYLPDGKEAKASPSTSVVSSVGIVPLEDLYQLNIFLQEALQKEHMLENKLATLQKIVESTRQSSELAWKALIDEDRLLSRVETLETQLQTTSKNFGEDKLREELRKLQEDKSQYQGTAKESLQKILEEKLDALLRLQALELSLSNSESECAHLKQLCDQGQQDLQELAQKFSAQLQKVEELTTKMQESEEQSKETQEKLELEKQEIQLGLEVQTEHSHELQARVDALQADGNLTHQRMTDLQSHLQLLKSNVENEGDIVKESMEIDQVNDEVILEYMDPKLDNTKEGVGDLTEKLQTCEDSLKIHKALVNELQGSSESYTLELLGAADEVQLAKVNLETIRSEEDISQAKANSMQERIENIDLEIDLISSEFDTNKCEEGDLPDSTGHITRLKAEQLALQELLAEERLKKRTIEEKEEGYKQELNAANSKLKALLDEANLLKQQLLTAEKKVATEMQEVEDLKQQKLLLETSLGQHVSGLGVLQGKLREETQRANKSESKASTLINQNAESQQVSKQWRNQAEKLKEKVVALEAAHAEASRKAEINHQQAEQFLQNRCSELMEENAKLHEELLDRAELVENAKGAKLREQELLRRLDQAGVPRDVAQDHLEEELVEVKTNFTSLTETLQKVNTEFEEYRLSHPVVQSHLADALDRLPLLAVAIVLLAIGLALYLS